MILRKSPKMLFDGGNFQFDAYENFEQMAQPMANTYLSLQKVVQRKGTQFMNFCTVGQNGFIHKVCIPRKISLGHDRGPLRGPENPCFEIPYVGMQYQNMPKTFWVLCPLEWFAQKTKSDTYVKKITFCFLTKSENFDWVILPKMGQKLIIT